VQREPAQSARALFREEVAGPVGGA
jgi:hypothetical protein